MLTFALGMLIWLLIGAAELGIIFLIEKKTNKETTEAEAAAFFVQLIFLLPLSFVIALAILPVV